VAGEKQPSAAHVAIAQLVAAGYVRVILTTNFDHLIEQALDQVGIRPVVISTAAAASGASPMQHNAITLIKLHGDYVDPNIRNTEEELSAYSHPMN
jgi:NAD-dependent SIR2 family protein deacetylase